MKAIERILRDIAIQKLAAAIAEDKDTDIPGYDHTPRDAEYAWAVQHINEVACHRNAFSGLTGMSYQQAENGLGNYLADRRLWNVRIYEGELMDGLRYCGLATDKGMITPDKILHNAGNKDFAEDWMAAGYASQIWPLHECPEKQDHKPEIQPFS